MTVNEWKNLPIFKENISTLKRTSRDSTAGEPAYMTDSEAAAVNFDKVKEAYVKDMQLSEMPRSIDALLIGGEDNVYFIEFKNGVIERKTGYVIQNKIYDSLLIFNDIVDENISYCRQKVSFILVYNESKNPATSTDDLQVSLSSEDTPKAQIAKGIHRLAKKNFVRFGLKKFEKLYFKQVFTYTESEFRTQFLPGIEG